MGETIEISVTKTATVPIGPVCVNWAYRTFMPPQQNFRCAHYRQESQAVTDRDMGGVTDRVSYLHSSHCAFFDTSLKEERGVGPYKCLACLKATEK